MNKARVLSNIGLAFRARAIVTGEEFSLKEIKSQSCYLVFLANDAGKNTTKRVTDKSTYYEIPLNTDFTSEELSKAIGKENRKVFVIKDRKFAKMLLDTINEI